MTWTVAIAPNPVEASAGDAAPCTGASARDHGQQLARSETRLLAGELVDVPGYCFVDASKARTREAIRQNRLEERASVDHDIYDGVSVHSVVAEDASQNSAGSPDQPELGSLELNLYNHQPPAGADELLATTIIGVGDVLERFTIAGTPVFVLEDAFEPDRVIFTWLRHGVQGILEGTDRAALDRWVRAYLATPVLAPGESEALAAWLVPVSGHAYANADVPELRKAWVTGPLGEVPWSIHRVREAQLSGNLGEVVLAEAPAGLSLEQYVSALGRHGLAGARPITTLTIRSTPVQQFRLRDGDALVWVQDGIAGAMTSTRVERATDFLTALLSAPR